MIKILLIEDDLGDIELTREALLESKLSVDLEICMDGVEAIETIRTITPDLILLDLNLPKKDGRTILTEIKADANLKFIPVVVLTTSQAQEDIIKSYDLGANCYISKPVGMEEFIKIVKSINDFWFTVVKLPKI